jgi:phosphoribosylanthranilate isomerase
VTYVKICGCRTVEEALAARDAGADFIGLVFAESPRRVSPETARQIAEALGRDAPTPMECRGGLQSSRYLPKEPSIALLPAPWERLLATKRPLLVGVFEGQSANEVKSISERAGIDVVQLHGDAPVDGLPRQLPLIRAVETAESATIVFDSPPVAICLLDSSRGRGMRGDWDALAAVASRLPVILAGGLTPENVAEAVRRVRPWGVDVSSGVETVGRKDAAKMRAFVAAAKGAIEQ